MIEPPSLDPGQARGETGRDPAHSWPAAWPRALTLGERAALLADAGPAAGEPEGDELASHRLLGWRSLSPFTSDESWRRRLADLGLDETAFARLLSRPAGELGARLAGLPDWAEEVAAAFAGGPPIEPAAPNVPTASLPEAAPVHGGLGLLALVEPLLVRARHRLAARLETVAAGPGAPFTAAGAVELAAASLPFRILPLLSRTLVLELHVARMTGELAGDTPEERFAAFVARLADPAVAAALLAEYPVLARQVATDLALWEEVHAELFTRLAADGPALLDTFFGGRDPGPLTGLDGGAGDRHRGGRAVRVLTFGASRLVYKPRSLAVDVHFQEILAWLNRQGDHPPLRTLAVLDRGDYGWMEFAAAAPCAEAADVARFHRRLGGLLALLFALEATDCHFENLIAAGDQPVVVDLESLFHPAPPPAEGARPPGEGTARSLAFSVLRVGLLPFQVAAGGIDLSGVAAVAGQPTPQKVLQWAGVGTDAMRVVRERAVMEGGRNLAVLEGREADAADHAADMAAGFTEIYHTLARHRDELAGLLAACAADPVRAVLRPTQVYALLLGESFHPDLLRDALDRDLFFDRLWIGTEEQPALARVVAAERRDLLLGDVPVFTTEPGSRHLWTSAGERLEEYFAEPALASVRRRLAALGEDDLRFQLWLLQLSLGARRLNRDDLLWQRYPPVAVAEAPDAPQLARQALAEAQRLGEWFAALAVCEGGHATWVGLDRRDGRWSLQPATEDLYAGLAGIALFLAFLGARTGDAGATGLARAAVRTLLLQASLGSDGRPGEGSLASIGAFQGWGGVVWTLAHLGALWEDGEILSSATPFVERIAARLDGDEELDLVGGAAGAIPGLLALSTATGARRPLEVAVACGERLLARAFPLGEGLGWLTHLATERPQIGISHGVAGIALALVRLGAATGDGRFRAAGLAGFAWERQAFWPELARWTREGEEPPLESTVAMAWCYGAPGVGLSRLLALPHVEEGETRAALCGEVDEAVAQTLARGFGQNHSLCHGDLGNLDFLLEVHRERGGEALEEEIRRLGQGILSSLARDGWLCGTRGSIEAPALMNGLAGIGYGLLRLADPVGVPSVLALAPPGG